MSALEPADAVDHVAIGRLQSGYGDAVTRQAWAELTAMFVADCPIRLDLRDRVVEVVGPEAIGSMIASSIERFEFFAFTIQNSVIDLSGDGVTATGRLYIRELRQEREGNRWTTAYGLYQDAYRKVDGAWRFARRDYSTLARTSGSGDGMDVFPIPGR
jgi:hypothetical protein